VKGWHEAQTAFMREVDSIISGVNASMTERNASVAVPIGTSSKLIELGVVTYPGSLLALSLRLEKAVTAGTVVATVTINGVDKFAATLNLAATQTAHAIKVPGAYIISQSDVIRVRIDGTGYNNADAVTSGLALNLVTSNDITTTALTIADASNTTKGITKLSVAPAIATEPVAVGTNDGRVPSQNENDALVGTSGTPSSGNPYVTNADSRNANARTPTNTRTATDLTDAATVDYNASTHNIYELTATAGIGATRLLANPSGLVKGLEWEVWFHQDAIGGRNLTVDSYYRFENGGSMPSLAGQGGDVSTIIRCKALSTTRIACQVLAGFNP